MVSDLQAVTSPRRILQPGRNCWKVVRAERVAFLVDAADYFEAFGLAAEQMKRSLVITAWDIDGRVRLRRDRPAETLRGLILRLLKQKPDAHVYVLNWDFILLYAGDRELLPWFDHPWHIHPRLHFHWDGRHPFWGSHHQKVVVMDDQLAFSGGLDFTDERWDTPAHYPFDRRRRPLHREHYRPFHDAMVMVEGPAAAALGDLARDRWSRASPPSHERNGFSPPPRVYRRGTLWPRGISADLTHVDVAIARTDPGDDEHPPVHEVERLFEDTIAAARRTLYIENQYFTSDRVTVALARRLREPGGPEIVLVLPKGCTNWIEEWSLGIARWRYVRWLRQQDFFGRLHVYYPEIDGLQTPGYIKVHSKIMIADDDFVRVGSANLCNRSMSIDTECDVAIEAIDDPAAQEGIRRFRARLLAEHLACSWDHIREVFQATQSLAETIRCCSSPGRKLVPFSGEVNPLLDRVMPKKLSLSVRRRL
jgi:phospholipase D1/2